MVSLRSKAYNLVLLFSLFGVALGCESKSTPPPGAPADTEVPSVDLGSESGAPQDTTGDATASPAITRRSQATTSKLTE